GADVEKVKLLGIERVAPRHAHVAEKELREEGQVEADEDRHGREARGQLGIKPTGHLGPPVMECGKVAHNHSAHHDVVKMCDDEVRVVEVHVDSERREHESCETADGEEADEAEDV